MARYVLLFREEEGGSFSAAIFSFLSLALVLLDWTGGYHKLEQDSLADSPSL